MSFSELKYGVDDGSYRAAGGLEGITQLVDAFYDFMEELPEAQVIRGMHRADLGESRKKLAYFLSGWLGGPKLYAENFGGIVIPKAHGHLAIGQNEVDAWMLCMQKAVDLQPYPQAFKDYLINQLRVPAERIRVVCEKNIHGE
ncbi:group II truncated hemoglobin [Gilvimarinus sp. SDUM040013]|uniref:Group II truncated hemoglobin n=1 Tax=Gilvimarinus gilvus TaxID=3058038 RepID=A0ABU4S409_9GAMM|nr:group II truncated hemoglobin [Gilvimarinus sp. SDUM040013]MDO3385438.1 group II truncated hemoglobin [Gilvimarinus sp. SDUM040013]MDX6851301.1 group II truncated hemoglobin [Gilvimarinus sp. SDUM040013]